MTTQDQATSLRTLLAIGLALFIGVWSWIGQLLVVYVAVRANTDQMKTWPGWVTLSTGIVVLVVTVSVSIIAGLYVFRFMRGKQFHAK